MTAHLLSPKDSSVVHRPVPALEDLLERFLSLSPEIVFEWYDKYTSARGYLVINSLRGGAAGGGTRMREGITKEEVLSLAKTMEVKFTISGPPIGGGKSGIAFNPEDPRKEEVLARWFKATRPLLEGYYGTGGDLNVDEIKEVIPITLTQGLPHPQIGIVRGHFEKDKEPSSEKLKRLQEGVGQTVEDSAYTPTVGRYTVADLITGYGVAESVKHYYRLWHKSSPKHRRAIVQGWGNVAAATAFYLTEQGVKIVGIIDKNSGILAQEGLSAETVRQLFLGRRKNQLISEDSISFEEVDERIWDLGAEIFVPAAASRLVSQKKSERLIAAGLRVVACGANVPFVEEEALYGPTTKYVDDNVSLLPDFIASSAMARVFAYLMSHDSKNRIHPVDIFRDTSSCINKALQKIHAISSTSRHIARTGLYKALQQIL